MLWKHGNNPVDKVNGSPSLITFLVNRVAGLNIMRNIGYMDAHFVIAVGQPRNGQSIIKIFGIFGVDGKGDNFPEIPAFAYFACSNCIGDSLASSFRLLLEKIKESQIQQG